jgi:hypothetical protein
MPGVIAQFTKQPQNLISSVGFQPNGPHLKLSTLEHHSSCPNDKHTETGTQQFVEGLVCCLILLCPAEHGMRRMVSEIISPH